ncbi:hypothetical protein STIUS_v1c01400 [Spiroplasma sp. TIUS-1]|uniref:hypothetical protein n=1 Tax=Spiroplasma sp. TIUS-1 TaxID=216963 RepID=UPI0013996CE2|nr:hypothetical protein [Spiroplasma sp. TIUS-1]QHX35695.1 hypothetical protein STIUS_v1c01400 [Spiroplasma sp. TIUS-1]
MSNSIKEIKDKKEISVDDNVQYRVIADIVSALFSDENGISKLTGTYKIDSEYKIWFVNLSNKQKKEKDIKSGYSIYLEENDDNIYHYNTTQNIKKTTDKYIEENIKLVVFVNYQDKLHEPGYHFFGIYKFNEILDNKIVIYKRESKTYKLN